MYRFRDLSSKLWQVKLNIYALLFLSFSIFVVDSKMFAQTIHVTMWSGSTQWKLQLLAHFHIPARQFSNQLEYLVNLVQRLKVPMGAT